MAKIIVRDVTIRTMKVNGSDYICITDIARQAGSNIKMQETSGTEINVICTNKTKPDSLTCVRGYRESAVQN